MNDNILTPEELIEEVEIQSLQELDECIETLSISYSEFLENKNDRELKELYLEASNDLKILLGDYSSEDVSLIQEAYEILFEQIKDEIED